MAARPGALYLSAFKPRCESNKDKVDKTAATRR